MSGVTPTIELLVNGRTARLEWAGSAWASRLFVDGRTEAVHWPAAGMAFARAIRCVVQNRDPNRPPELWRGENDEIVVVRVSDRAVSIAVSTSMGPDWQTVPIDVIDEFIALLQAARQGSR